MLQRFLIPNPAVGADWQWTVPGEWRASIVSVHAELVATAQPVSSTDQSGNAHTLAYNAAMYTHETFGVVGPFGGGGGLAVDCRSYDSRSNNTLGSTQNATGLLDKATFSFEAILNCANTGNVTQAVIGLDDAGVAPTHFRCGLMIDRGGVPIRAIAATGDTPSLGGGIGLNTWGQIGCTYDGAQWVGITNGVAGAAVVGHPPTLTQVNDPLFVMGDGVSSQGCNGLIAAAAYYNGVLPAANYLNHFNAIATSAAAYRAAVLVDTPLAFWMLNDVQTHFQRTTTLVLTDGTSTIARYPGFAPTQQGDLFSWTWSVDGSGAAQNPTQTVTIVPINPVTLPSGYTVGVSTLDLTAFDQWENIVVWADVSDSGGGAGGGAGGTFVGGLLVPDYSHSGG